MRCLGFFEYLVALFLTPLEIFQHKLIRMRKQLPQTLTFKTLCLLLFLCFAQISFAQPKLILTPLISNLNKPIAVRNADDGSGRIFICEQSGLIKIYKNGTLLSKPFLDLRSIVEGNQEYPGLYSIAFAPDYETSRYFFVYYVTKDNYTILARYQTSKKNPDSAVFSSGVTLISINGRGTGGAHTGDMHFGKDGYLYISFNDGSFYANATKFAQDGDSFLGKILRLNVSVKNAPYYSVPADNPFVNNPTIKSEIWAFGIRNAWRWSFDRFNNFMWVSDVGADKWEEVSVRTPAQPAGPNFGWPCYEGNARFDTTGCKAKKNYVFPVFQYKHVSATSAEVITGGYVYRGTDYPSLYGYYVCADYTTGNAWRILRGENAVIVPFKQTGLPTGIVDFGEDESGELYASSLSNGIVYRVGATPAVIIASTNVSKEKAYSK